VGRNIKIDFAEIVWGGVAQNRDKWRDFVNAVMNLAVL
jgi:hypothetical protein